MFTIKCCTMARGIGKKSEDWKINYQQYCMRAKRAMEVVTYIRG